MKRLGVNIDHIATIRNVRGENHPKIIEAAKFVMKCGANSITIHLREDRRHIKDIDLKEILKEGDILITMGAGDVWKIGEKILLELKK